MGELITNLTVTLIPVLSIIVGALAFIVSMITEVIKNVSFLRRIPTDCVVIALSLVITIIALIAYMTYMQQTIYWYYIAGAVICAFFVAFIAMFGWEKITELWYRFRWQ